MNQNELNKNEIEKFNDKYFTKEKFAENIEGLEHGTPQFQEIRKINSQKYGNTTVQV